MIKSIQNDGEFEGGKAMMHTRRCALTRVLLWPVRTPLKLRLLGSKPDNPEFTLSKQLSWLTVFFLSYCFKTLISKNPTVCATVGHKNIPTPSLREGTLSPPTPRVRSIGSAQKYFPDFHQGVFQ